MKWLLIVLGFLVGGLVFALANIARTEYEAQYPILRIRWIGLIGFTLLAFGFVCREFRSSWNRPVFWVWCAALLALHVAVYVWVLSAVTEWRAIWFVLITIVEVPALASLLERLGFRASAP